MSTTRSPGSSPAASAGIRPGDRLVAVNGRPIGSYLQLLRKVALLAPGTEAKLTLLREGGAQQDVAVRLVARPAAACARSESCATGLLFHGILIASSAFAGRGVPPDASPNPA